MFFSILILEFYFIGQIGGKISSPCYDSNNKDDLRLWDNCAPGAMGEDPCQDIPFLKVFHPNGSIGRTDTGIVLIPGGGYDQLTNNKEQTPVARYFADKLGVTTFILSYRLVQKNGTYRYPVPMWDGQRALRYVRSNAAKYKIKPDHVGAFGFSAGGHLASTIALHPHDNFNLSSPDNLDKTDAKPDFIGLGYPVISMDPQQFASNASRRHLLHGYEGKELSRLQDFLSGQKHVTAKCPPTFLFESLDDQRISAQNSVLFTKALENAKVPHESHIVEHGRHGAGLAPDQPEEKNWPELFGKWLAEMKFISKP